MTITKCNTRKTPPKNKTVKELPYLKLSLSENKNSMTAV